MTIAGLILIDGEGGGATPSLLPVAGQPLIELQARVARGAGVEQIVVVIDAMPNGLVACIDRLRAEGVNIDLARDPADAADRVHPDEELIVFAGGVAISREALQAAIATGPVIAGVPDGEATAHLERIDGTRRWTGLAIVDGALLRSTAQMLGDWTLGPTLLRKALQNKVEVREIEGVLPVGNVVEARAASRALTAGSTASKGAFERLVAGPLVSAAMPVLTSRRLPVGAVSGSPFVLLLASAAGALVGWPVVGLALLLLASAPLLVAERLSHLSGKPLAAVSLARAAELPVFAASALVLAWQSYALSGDWGALALAAWLIVALALQPVAATRRIWIADAQSGALTLLIAALAGQPLAGIIVALTHAVLTQFWMVRRLG